MSGRNTQREARELSQLLGLPYQKALNLIRAKENGMVIVGLQLTVTIQTDRETALQVVRHLLSEDEGGNLDVYLSELKIAIRSAVANKEPDKLEDALDRLTEVAALAISFKPTGAACERAVGVFHDSFDYGLHRNGGVGKDYPREELLVAIVSRARALGALAVRLEHWAPLRHLILHQTDSETGTPTWQTWFRYTDVWANRAHVYAGDLVTSTRAPLKLAAEHALRLAALRPDTAADEDALITSVCQFDLITNFVATKESAANGLTEAAYPYFVAWSGDRVSDTAALFVSDLACRSSLLPDIGDDELADLLREVSDACYRLCGSMGALGWWNGFFGGTIRAFLNAHPPRP